jgi:dihydroorotate dehydrogenase (NAD+) catalytic subunit
VVDLSTDLGFIKLKNPVITASGTFGYGEEFQDFFNLDILGAFCIWNLWLW